MIMIKTLNKLERNFLNLLKGIYKNTYNESHGANLTTNLNGAKLNVFLLRSGIRQGCLLLSNIVFVVLTNATRQEKEMEGVQIGKEEIQVPRVAPGM